MVEAFPSRAVPVGGTELLRAVRARRRLEIDVARHRYAALKNPFFLHRSDFLHRPSHGFLCPEDPRWVLSFCHPSTNLLTSPPRLTPSNCESWLTHGSPLACRT